MVQPPGHAQTITLQRKSMTALPHELSTVEPQSTPFQYLSLDTSTQSIRLIRFAQGDYGVVHGTLEHFELASCPAYIALSYEWGTNEATKPVLLNSSHFQVRTNLYEFLVLFAQRHRDEWLWVDQVRLQTDVSRAKGDQY